MRHQVRDLHDDDRDGGAEFLHVYTRTLAGGFFFEIAGASEQLHLETELRGALPVTSASMLAVTPVVSASGLTSLIATSWPMEIPRRSAAGAP